MKIYNSDGSILMGVKAVERNGSNLEFRGTVLGSMPVKGRVAPAEARSAFRLIKGWRMRLFVLTFLVRRGDSAGAARNG